MAKPGYGGRYRRDRAQLLADEPLCAYCGRRPATTADHVPPLCTVPDRTRWTGVLVPSCRPCSLVQAGQLGGGRKLPRPSRQW